MKHKTPPQALPSDITRAAHKIGIISDTHDFMDPKALQLLAGVEHILHAGDIGRPKIILELEAIAPVTAVAGNTDDPGFNYPMTEKIELFGRKFLVHHIVNPHALTEDLGARIERERPDVVVFGHTHKRFSAVLDGTLFFNPGYAGKSRFGMERSLAILHCDDNDIRPEFFVL